MQLSDRFSQETMLGALNLARSLGNLPLDFTSVKENPSESGHVTIAVSGWLSQNDEQSISWAGLPEGSPIYALNWKAQENKDLFKTIGKVMLKVAEGVGSILLSGGSFGIIALLGLAKKATDVHKLFCEAIKQAKETGKKLACALILGYPFQQKTISLIGFSLGC
jgi:hypothetical protein